jgi:anthranilate phosphoribosyltransferase
MAEYTAQSFRPLLNRLVQTPEYFDVADLTEALNHLFTPDALHPAQIGAFLTALHIHRVERRPESLAAAASVLRQRALQAAVQEKENDFVVDIVGTGGDGYNLFNVSTTAAVVAAGAGARVIKVCFFFAKSRHTNPILLSTGVEHRRLPQAPQISSNR